MAGYLLSRVGDFAFDMLPGILLALLAFFCLRPWRLRRLERRGLVSSPRREAVLSLLWAFAGGMSVLTLLPRWVSHSLVDLLHGYNWNAGENPFFQLGGVNLVPFRTLQDPFIFLGNIVMFVPFGFFAALLWRGYTWRRALVTGFGITGFIECWQLLIGRAFDIDDLLLNTLGVLCGYWLWRLLNVLAPGVSARFRVKPAS